MAIKLKAAPAPPAWSVVPDGVAFDEGLHHGALTLTLRPSTSRPPQDQRLRQRFAEAWEQWQRQAPEAATFARLVEQHARATKALTDARLAVAEAEREWQAAVVEGRDATAAGAVVAAGPGREQSLARAVELLAVELVKAHQVVRQAHGRIRQGFGRELLAVERAARERAVADFLGGNPAALDLVADHHAAVLLLSDLYWTGMPGLPPSPVTAPAQARPSAGQPLKDEPVEKPKAPPPDLRCGLPIPDETTTDVVTSKPVPRKCDGELELAQETRTGPDGELLGDPDKPDVMRCRKCGGAHPDHPVSLAARARWERDRQRLAAGVS
jgi:hypothetical protein